MLFETGYFKNNYFYKFSFISVAFLAFLHMIRMVKMEFALVAIMLLATSMSKTYLTKTGSKRFLIKTGANLKTQKMTTTPVFNEIEQNLDDDHQGGLGEDEVCVINVFGGWFLIS